MINAVGHHFPRRLFSLQPLSCRRPAAQHKSAKQYLKDKH